MRPIFLNRANRRIEHNSIRQRRRSRILAWLQSIGLVLVVGLLNGLIGG